MRAKRIKQEGQLDSWQLSSETGDILFKYNKRLQTIRVNSGDRKVFFLEKSGLFHSRIRFTNEYSQPAGELQFDSHQSLSGTLAMPHEKFRFEKTVTRVLLYDRKKCLAGSLQLDDRMVNDSSEFAAILFAFVRYQRELSVPASLAL